MNQEIDFSILKGKILKAVDVHDDEIYFTTDNDEKYKMYHQDDCCESVTIEDIAGEIDWLIDSPILIAEERTNSNDDPKVYYGYPDDSFTWTFYEIATLKGAVTIRWYGSSNGYYSESVNFKRIQ